MIDGQNFFDQPVKSNIRTFKRLQLVKEMITQLVFIRLSLFQKTLQDDGIRFK